MAKWKKGGKELSFRIREEREIYSRGREREPQRGKEGRKIAEDLEQIYHKGMKLLLVKKRGKGCEERGREAREARGREGLPVSGRIFPY